MLVVGRGVVQRAFEGSQAETTPRASIGSLETVLRNCDNLCTFHILSSDHIVFGLLGLGD